MSDSPRIAALRRRVERDPASIAFAQLAEEYRRDGQYADAVRVCRAGLARHPGYISARVTLGRALLELGELAAARAELEQVLRAAPENLAAIHSLAELHQRGEPPTPEFEPVPAPAAVMPDHTPMEPPLSIPPPWPSTRRAGLPDAGVDAAPGAPDALDLTPPGADPSDPVAPSTRRIAAPDPVTASSGGDDRPLGPTDWEDIGTLVGRGLLEHGGSKAAARQQLLVFERWLEAILADRARRGGRC